MNCFDKNSVESLISFRELLVFGNCRVLNNKFQYK